MKRRKLVKKCDTCKHCYNSVGYGPNWKCRKTGENVNLIQLCSCGKWKEW